MVVLVVFSVTAAVVLGIPFPLKSFFCRLYIFQILLHVHCSIVSTFLGRLLVSLL